jgi:hypothetical protein
MKKHVTKEEWIAMYEEIGLDARKRMKWHNSFL